MLLSLLPYFFLEIEIITIRIIVITLWTRTYQILPTSLYLFKFALHSTFFLKQQKRFRYLSLIFKLDENCYLSYFSHFFYFSNVGLQLCREVERQSLANLHILGSRMGDCAQTAVYRLTDQKEGNVKIGNTKYRWIILSCYSVLGIVIEWYMKEDKVIPKSHSVKDYFNVLLYHDMIYYVVLLCHIALRHISISILK